MITVKRHTTKAGKETVTVTITDEDVKNTEQILKDIMAREGETAAETTSAQRTLQEFIDRDFGGNISTFARAYDISRPTAYNLLAGKTKAQNKLRERLKRKGVVLP